MVQARVRGVVVKGTGDVGTARLRTCRSMIAATRSC
jgi:hypothetical protein